MLRGEIGLYQDENGVIYASLNAGDQGVPLETLLPPEMRGEAFAKARIGDYFKFCYLSFATQHQIKAWNTAIKQKMKVHPGQSFQQKPPVIDTKALKLENDRGEIDYARVQELFSLVWPYLDKEPTFGLIAALFAEDFTYPEMVDLLAMYDRSGGKLPYRGFTRDLLDMFVPPGDTQSGPRAFKENAEFVLSWCRRPGGEPGLKQDNLYWNLNFRELGIVDDRGHVVPEMARKARAYIWADPDREPDYFALRNHLAPIFQAKKPQAEKPLPKAAQDKLKKRQRKAGRVNRGRRR